MSQQLAPIEHPWERTGRGALAVFLGLAALAVGVGLTFKLEPARQPRPTVSFVEHGLRTEQPSYSPVAVSITPITSLTSDTTGALYVSADRIDLWARTSSSTATLNLVEYLADDAKWAKVGADCAVTTSLTQCRFVAKRGARYWHVYKASGSMAYVGLEALVLPVGQALGSIEAGGAAGTVTSVALSLPSELTVAGSPVTSSGTLSATWANQSPNRVFAGPTSGGAATPAFRALVAADLPSVWPSNYQFATLTGGVSTSRCYYSGGNASGCTNSTNNTSVATPKGWLPSGSVWTLRCGNSSTVPSGSTITISLYTSSTVNGTYTEDTGSRVSFDNASGSNAEGTATYTAGSNVWFLFSTIKDAVGAPYTGYVNCALTRSG